MIDDIIFSVILGMTPVLMVVSIYFLVRNNRVYRFRCKLIEMGYEVCSSYSENTIESWDYGYQKKLDETWHSISEIPYDKMLYSFKPLKIENWLTDVQQEFLKLKF